MPDDPNDNQQPVTPDDPDDMPVADSQPESEPSPTAERADGSTASAASPPDETAGATPAAADSMAPSEGGEVEAETEPAPAETVERVFTADVSPTADEAHGSNVSADEVEAAMQEMLTAAEKPAAREVPGQAAGSSSNEISADEVEAAMQAMLEAASETNGTQPASSSPIANSVSADEIEAALQAAGDPVTEASTVAGGQPPQPDLDTSPFNAPDFSEEASGSDTSQIDLLDDVELDVKIELGRAEMYIQDVLGLGAGSVVELDKAAGDPVDIFVNDRLVARGEVLVLNDNFCVRINDIISPVPELDR